ncbi:hypothetical protein [Sphingobium tyrosinilyticum]|uniref:Uncharacterized protein n=1 Tax=Sphingobium tyrosinilyticum TaxID=2715436 RepID=A0ABV9EZH2_9SPHN
MLNNSAMCKRQAAHHRQVAAASSLEKVRGIALKAAGVWEIQAAEAEARETGTPDVLSRADAAIAMEFRLEEEALTRQS